MLPPQQLSLPSRRPLRSSPLAGPALSPSQPPGEDGMGPQKEKRPRLVRPSTAPSTPTPSISRPSPRISFYITEPSRDDINTGHSSPPRSPPKSLPTSIHTPKVRSLSHQVLDASPFPSMPATAAGSEWMATNTYSTTPRFSRLSLGASGVVLPVSVKDHRRKSISRTSSSGTFSRDLGKLNSPSMPSLTRTESGASSLKESALVTPSSPRSISGLTNSIASPTIENRVSMLLSPSPHSCTVPQGELKTKGSKTWKSISLRAKRSMKRMNGSTRSSLDKGQGDNPILSLPSLPNQGEKKDGTPPKRSGTLKRILKAFSPRRSNEKLK